MCAIQTVIEYDMNGFFYLDRVNDSFSVRFAVGPRAKAVGLLYLASQSELDEI